MKIAGKKKSCGLNHMEWGPEVSIVRGGSRGKPHMIYAFAGCIAEGAKRDISRDV
jgi:hypothetical protein